MVKYPDNGDDLTDYTRHLVTVLPKGANVRVTDALPVSDDTGDGSHFADHDLRRDVLIHCHDNREHPSLAETSRDVILTSQKNFHGKFQFFHSETGVRNRGEKLG